MSLLFLAAVAVVPAGQTFECTPTRVWDGDGPVWCAEGPRIRLSGIAAREMDGTCRSNQRCPAASAEQSRDALARLVGRPSGKSREGHVLVSGPTMTCRSVGSGGGNRPAPRRVSPKGGDLSCAMIEAGFALRWDRYWGAIDATEEADAGRGGVRGHGRFERPCLGHWPVRLCA